MEKYTIRLQRLHDLNPAWLLLAPVATVAFLLMFFLLLSTSFILQPGIAVKPPSSPFLLPPQHDPLVVSITGFPFPTIFFDNQKANLKDLGNWLDNRYHRTHSLIVKADKSSPIGLVTEVLNQGLQHGYSVTLATQRKLQE